MKTSWNEIRQIEAHLMRTQVPADALLFEAHILLDDEMTGRIAAQQKVYEMVWQFGRKELRKEIDAVHQTLFTQPEHIPFKEKIKRFFKTT